MTAAGGSDAGDVFEAPSDRTRRQIITWLAAEGHMSATWLAARLPLTRQGVAKHLLVMADSGIVIQSREGREVLFSMDIDRLGSAIFWLTEVGAHWDRRLESLEEHVKRRGTRRN